MVFALDSTLAKNVCLEIGEIIFTFEKGLNLFASVFHIQQVFLAIFIHRS